jgi:hypothetical protein
MIKIIVIMISKIKIYILIIMSMIMMMIIIIIMIIIIVPILGPTLNLRATLNSIITIYIDYNNINNVIITINIIILNSESKNNKNKVCI